MSLRRVIFVNRVYWPSPAATAQLLTDLAEELAARGHEVHVIAAGRAPGARHGVTIHRTGEGEQHGGLFSRVGNYAKFLFGARQRLAGLARAGDIVVVKTDPPLLGAFVARTVRKKNARLVHWIQDIYPEILGAHLGAWSKLPLRPLTWWRNRSWLAADACVTLGDDMASTLLHGGVAREKIFLLPNWAPKELHAPASPAAVAARKAAWGLTGKFIVAYSGNLGRVHEFDAIVEAAACLKDDPAIRFVFIGRGAQFDRVQTKARELGLGNLLFLPPEPREQLPAALAAADVHLVTLKPAFSKLVFPSKLAGILAAGRPALFVGPSAGDIARLLAEEACGAGVPPDRSRELAGLVKAWQTEPARWTALAQAARRAYERRYTFQAVVARWELLLRSIA